MPKLLSTRRTATTALNDHRTMLRHRSASGAIIGLFLFFGSGAALAAPPPPPVFDNWQSLNWGKGGTVLVYIDEPPPGYTGGREVIEVALANWTAGQQDPRIKGLKLIVTKDPKQTQIHIKFKTPNDPAKDPFGQVGSILDKDQKLGNKPVLHVPETDPLFVDNKGKPLVTVPITIFVRPEIVDKDGNTIGGLNRNGNFNVILHELGHSEGLAHDNALSKDPADYETNINNVLMAEGHLNEKQLNDTHFRINARNLATKKSMWGTATKIDKTLIDSERFNLNGPWHYNYIVKADSGNAGFIEDFDIYFPKPLTETDFLVTAMPDGWGWNYISGLPDIGVTSLDSLASPPPMLQFFSTAPEFALSAGSTAMFSLVSGFGPSTSSAAAYSTNYDLDVSSVFAPGAVPEPTTWTLMVSGMLWVGVGLRRRNVARLILMRAAA